MVGLSRPNGGVGKTATRRNSHAFTSRFSLIELIVVAVILAILGGIGAAVYSSSKTKGGTSVGAGRIADAIAAARQTAISENTAVALLLPEGSDRYSDEFPGRLPSGVSDAGVAMRLCELDENGDFLDWLPGHGWITMPERTYFNVDFEFLNKVNFNDTVGGSCDAIVFKPNGTLPFSADLQVSVRPFPEIADSTRFSITVNWLTGLSEISKVED